MHGASCKETKHGGNCTFGKRVKEEVLVTGARWRARCAKGSCPLRSYIIFCKVNMTTKQAPLRVCMQARTPLASMRCRMHQRA